MHSSWGNSEINARESGGQFRPPPPPAGGIVRPLFGPFARLIWPFKTDAHIAAIADCDVRTARRYLSGELDPPACVWARMWLLAIESRKPK